MNESIQKKALSAADVEAIYGIPTGTLANMRCQKRGPRFFKIGRKKVVYFPEDVEPWLRSCPIETIDSLKG